MKPVLALDMDEIMFPFMKYLLEFVNQRDQAQWSAEHFHTFDFEDVWGGTRTEATATVDSFFDQLGEHPEPIEGSVSAIATLAEMFSLYVVTARHDSLEDATMSWLKAHFPDSFDGVHLCNLYNENQDVVRSKVDVCVQLDAVALVDDSLQNVTDVAATGSNGILFGDFAWNRATHLPARVTRVADWQGVVAELRSLA